MIYYIEDDANIRELVVYTLNQTGLSARGFSDSVAFFTAMQEEKPSLVLLDIMLPGEDGLTILKKIRSASSTASLPVMMITAKSAEYDKVTGLDLGADDYIAKPFGMAELVARVKALLRRSGMKTGSDRLVCGELTVDVAKHTVTVGTANVQLTYKEFSLLVRLMESAGRAFTREQLLETVWGYDYEGGTRTVDVHVQALRAKLGESGKYIETVRGVGYRFGE